MCLVFHHGLPFIPGISQESIIIIAIIIIMVTVLITIVIIIIIVLKVIIILVGITGCGNIIIERSFR